MVRIPKASLGFKQEDPAKKIVVGGAVVDKLTVAEATIDNPFTNLPVKITALQDANDALIAASKAAESKSVVDVKSLELIVNEWDQKFLLTANYVSLVASSAPLPAQVISRAGFTPTKDSTTPNPLPVPSTTFTVFNNGKKGAIIAESQKKVDFARGYIYGAFPQDALVEFENNVMKVTMGGKTCYIAADTKRKVEFFNLPQTPLKVISYAFNSAGSGPATKSVTITPGIIDNN